MSLNSLIVVESINNASLKVNPKVRLSDKLYFRIFAHVVEFPRKQNYYMKGKPPWSTLLIIFVVGHLVIMFTGKVDLKKLSLQMILIVCLCNVILASCSIHAEPPSPPTGLSVNDLTSRSFTLSWDASSDGGGISGCQVFMDENSIGTSGTTSLPVYDLEPCTIYKMAVRAHGSNGDWSAMSSALDVKTECSNERTITHGSDLKLSDVGTTGQLTPSGSLTTSQDNQVIENLQITGQIIINHDSVTVRNCKILHGNGLDGIVVSAGKTGALIEHCEFNGLNQVLGNYGSMGVVIEGNATVRRCYCHNVRSGMSILHPNGSGSFIENYVRDLCDANDAHNTSASCHGTTGPVQVLRNNFVAGNSAGFSLYSDFGSNTDVLIRDNFIIGQNAGYGMYCGYTHLENGNAEQNSDIRIIGNRFKPPFLWGPVCALNMSQPGAVWEDNTFEDGTPISPKQDI